jgi:hypothetical protein
MQLSLERGYLRDGYLCRNFPGAAFSAAPVLPFLQPFSFYALFHFGHTVVATDHERIDSTPDVPRSFLWVYL